MNKPDIKPEYFCMAPWTHTYISPQSERRLCCASREPAQNFTQYIDTASGSHQYKPLSLEQWWNSEHVRRVRTTMMRGDIPPECEVCNHKLLNTDVYRDYFWHLFRDRYDEVWKTTDENGYTTMQPRSWDWRFSNLCNFKCRMCGDMLSSSWESEQKTNNMVNWDNPNNAWMKEPVRTRIAQWQENATEKEFGAAVRAGTVEEIYWVGGEPLMYEQHWNYMQQIVDLGYADRVYVRYNTNLSRVEYKGIDLWSLLKHFRDWQICASLDGTGVVGEYIRSGLKYNQWLKNFEQASKQTKHARQLKLDFTLTLPGLLEIENIVDLSKQFNVQLLSKVTFAFSPDILMSPMALPRTLLNEIIHEKLDWLKQNSNANQKSIIDTLEHMFDRPVFSEQWPDCYKDSAVLAKKRYQKLDQIRSGSTMEQILKKDKRLLDWWNSIYD